LAPRALSPKWTPLHLPCASWLAVYIGLCYQLAFALDSQSIVALKAQASTFFSPGRTLQVMNALPSRPRPLPPRPHWTEPVSREETLARREKFQKIGWLPPNHKPKTKKIIATAKRLWDKYVIRGCHLFLQRGVTVCRANGVSSGIVSILVSMPIHTFWKASTTTLNLGSIRSTVQLKRRRTIVLVYTGNSYVKSTASWRSSLWTASPLNKCEGYGVSRSIN
jgi:hypothetical protein